MLGIHAKCITLNTSDVNILTKCTIITCRLHTSQTNPKHRLHWHKTLSALIFPSQQHSYARSISTKISVHTANSNCARMKTSKHPRLIKLVEKPNQVSKDQILSCHHLCDQLKKACHVRGRKAKSSLKGSNPILSSSVWPAEKGLSCQW